MASAGSRETMSRVLLLEDLSTWPTSVTEWTQRYARLTPDQREASIGRVYEAEDAFRALLCGERLRVYHCTRLLDHESGWIQAGGLLPLSAALVERRIRAARAEGHLTLAEHDELLASNVFATGTAQSRENQICFVAGRESFDDGSAGWESLLATWGGEGIYFAAEHLHRLLGKIGTPTIVPVTIDLGLSQCVAPAFPPLAQLFIARAAGDGPVWADVFYPFAVPAADVLDLWQPGHPEYDRHIPLIR